MSDNPITRKELYLAKLSGQDVEIPEPITREEKYLYAAIMSGGGGGTGGATPDWNAAEGESGHIMNRTHYPLEPVTAVETLFDQVFSLTDGQCVTGLWFQLEEGKTYAVKWEGTEYECVCTVLDFGETFAYVLGNMGAFGGEDSGEPFVIAVDETNGITILVDLAGNTTVSAVITAEVTRTPLKPLNIGYFPDSTIELSSSGLSSGNAPKMIEILNKGLVLRNDNETILSARFSPSSHFVTYIGTNDVFSSFRYAMDNEGSPERKRGYQVSYKGIDFCSDDGFCRKLRFDESGYPYVEYGTGEDSTYEGVRVWHGGYLYSPGGKKFKLLVDDNGNLSTSEVTT